jgi:hypothetical protein
MEEKLDKMIELLERLVEAKYYRGQHLWDEDQEALIEGLYYQDADIPDMVAAIKEEFGIDRSATAVIARLGKLKLPKKVFAHTVIEEEKPKRKKSSFINTDDDKSICDRIYEDPPF